MASHGVFILNAYIKSPAIIYILHAATISMHQLTHVTIAILVLGANCYSLGIQNVPRGEDGTAPKINGFVSSLYSCLHSGRNPSSVTCITLGPFEAFRDQVSCAFEPCVCMCHVRCVHIYIYMFRSVNLMCVCALNSETEPFP